MNAAIVPVNTPTPEVRQNDPYRCELYSILLGLHLVYDLEQRHHSTYHNIIVSVDNNSALNQAIVYNDPIDATYQHFDILMCIRQLCHNIRTPLTFEYVEGHRDKIIAYSNLTRTEQLNVDCDSIAKTIRSNTDTVQDLTPVLILPYERILIWHRNQKIYNNFAHHLDQIGCTDKAEQYYCNKYNCTHIQFHSINWPAIDKAMHLCTPSTRTWISKFSCGFIGSAQMLSRREYWLEPTCPRCRSHVETCVHIIKCTSDLCRTALNESLNDLYAWMTTTSTASILQNEIKRITTYWLDNEVDTSIISPCPAVTSQITLEWNHFVFGRIHRDITALQNNHYITIGSKRDARSWSAQLIQRLWTKIIRPLWNQRNVRVHGSPNQPSPSRLLADMREEVREIFTTTNIEDLSYPDRQLLDGPLDILLSSSLPQLTAWRNSIELALADARHSFQNPSDPSQTHLPGTQPPSRAQPTHTPTPSRATTHTSHPLLTPIQLRIARRRHRGSKKRAMVHIQSPPPQAQPPQPANNPPANATNPSRRQRQRRRRPRLRLHLTPRVDSSTSTPPDEPPSPRNPHPSHQTTDRRRR